MVRKRGAELLDDDDSSDSDSDSDYRRPNLKGSSNFGGARRKAAGSQQQKRRLPTRVTPEQILSNAAAAAKKKRRQREGLPSVPPPPVAVAVAQAAEYNDDALEVAIVAERSRRDEHVVAAAKPERVVLAATRSAGSGSVLDEAASEEEAEGSEHEGEEEEAEDERDEEEDDVAVPVVFQCGTCRSIFGDSYAFVGSSAELLLVTLSAVTNVTASTEPVTARDGIDAGSSFYELLCAQCQTVLGRKYLTTPGPLDGLRGLFSFATTAIASYQLGYPQLQAAVAGGGGGGGRVDARRSKQGPTDADAAAADRRELQKLREDMTNVQNLLLVVDDRLLQLEDDPQLEGVAEYDELDAAGANLRR